MMSPVGRAALSGRLVRLKALAQNDFSGARYAAAVCTGLYCFSEESFAGQSKINRILTENRYADSYRDQAFLDGRAWGDINQPRCEGRLQARHADAGLIVPFP